MTSLHEVQTCVDSWKRSAILYKSAGSRQMAWNDETRGELRAFTSQSQRQPRTYLPGLRPAGILTVSTTCGWARCVCESMFRQAQGRIWNATRSQDPKQFGGAGTHLDRIVPIARALADRGPVSQVSPGRGLVVGSCACLRLLADRVKGRSIHPPFVDGVRDRVLAPARGGLSMLRLGRPSAGKRDPESRGRTTSKSSERPKRR